MSAALSALSAVLLLPAALLLPQKPLASASSHLRLRQPFLSMDDTEGSAPVSATDDPAVLALAGTCLRLSLNIGREPGTWMPSDWAVSGARLVLPVDVALTPELAPSGREPERLLGESPFFSEGVRRLSVRGGEARFVSAQGEVCVPITDGAWRAVSISGEGGGEYYLRGYLDFPIEASRNDVTLPAGRVFFTSGFWEVEGFSEAEARSERIRKEIGVLREQSKKAAAGGIGQLRRAVQLQEKLERLYQMAQACAVPEREELLEAGGGQLLLANAGGLCVKRRGPPWRFFGEEYHILGRCSFSAVDSAVDAAAAAGAQSDPPAESPSGIESAETAVRGRLGDPRMMCSPEAIRPVDAPASAAPAPAPAASARAAPLPSVAEGEALLAAYDASHRAAAASEGALGLGGALTANEWAAGEQAKAGAALGAAVRSLRLAALPTGGRVMLGICAEDAAAGIAALKAWVGVLKLPKGLLHGMDKDGEPIDMRSFGAVYIKYNSLPSSSDPAGTATLSGYGGDFRGVYFSPDLNDGQFRQYAVMPLTLFDESIAGAGAAATAAAPPAAAPTGATSAAGAGTRTPAAVTPVAAAYAAATSAEASTGDVPPRPRFVSRELGLTATPSPFATLHSKGYVRLPKPPPLAPELITAILGSPWEPIFNGQEEAPQRFQGRTQAWASELEQLFADELAAAGLLACSGGAVKQVRDCYALRSLPCVGADATDAALVGRQPAHSDAPEPRDASSRVELLDNADVPLSAMLAIQPGTCLWVFPGGCGALDRAELVSLEEGELLVWRGDLVHAGAGYAQEHVRVHTYVDPPPEIFERRRGQTNLCPSAKTS